MACQELLTVVTPLHRRCYGIWRPNSIKVVAGCTETQEDFAAKLGVINHERWRYSAMSDELTFPVRFGDFQAAAVLVFVETSQLIGGESSLI